MNVLSITDYYVEDDLVTVFAVVDDAKVKYYATYNYPEEKVPALCKSNFYLCDGEKLPPDDELLNYIDSLNLDWEVVDDDF